MSFSPSLFIGIGGVGKNILLNIRRMIVEEFATLSSLPSIGFVHIDTDTNKNPDAGSDVLTEVLGYDLTFKDTERIDLSEAVVNEIAGDVDNIKNNPKIKKWLDPNLKIDINFKEGAGGIRPYGRLAFQYSVTEYREKVNDIIGRVLELQNQRIMSDVLGTSSDGNLNTYIVCSFLGGTGSGSFLEVCYNLRKVLSQRGILSKIIGVFVIGGDVDYRRKANCYNALKELQYYFLPDTTFDADYPVPNAGPVVGYTAAPVDLCYFISSFSEGYQLTRGELEEAAALNLFLEFSSPISQEKQGRRVDITSVQQFNTPDPKTGKPRCFISFGIASLAFPVFKIQDMMAYEMASAALKSWLFENRETKANIEELEKAINRNTLVKILLNPDAQNILHETEQDIKGKHHETLTGQESEQLSTIKGHFEDFQRRFRFSTDPREWGELTRRIQIKGINELTSTVQSLNSKISTIEEDEYKGPNEARAFLHSLNSYTVQVLQDTGRRYTRYQQELENNQKDFYNCLNYLRMNTGKGDRFAVNHWIKKGYESLLKYVHTYLYVEAHRVIIEMLEKGLINDDGKKLRALKEEIQIILDDVEKYKENLSRLSKELFDKKEELEKAILGFRSCRELGIDKTKLKDITRSIVTDPSVYSVSLMKDVIYALSQKNSEGAIIQISHIRFLVNKNQQHLVNCLLLECKEKYRDIKKYSIAKVLLEKKNIIGDYIRRSRPMLSTANHDIGENMYVEWLATSNPDDNDDLRRIVEYIFTIKEYRGMHRRHLKLLVDNYRIIFASEKGIFPLERITILKELRKDYMRLKPSSTDIKIDYPDIFIEESGIPQRAEQAALLGRIFGFLIEQPDPETKYDYIYLTYHDESMRQDRYIKLTEKWDSLEDYLIQKQVDKEVIQKETSETSLEILENLIAKKGNKPKTKEDKEALGEELSRYLENLKNQLEGKESNEEFIRQLKIIEAYMNKYRLPVVAAKIYKEVPVSDSKVVTAKVDNEIPALDSKEDEFRGDLKILIGQKGVTDKTLLIKRGIIRWKLEPKIAEKLVEEALHGDRDKLYKEYREALGTCLIAGEITANDRTFLMEKQKEIGLTDDEVKLIEEEQNNMYKAYREAIETCLIAGEITANDRTFLMEKQKETGLTKEQAKLIEKELING